MKAETKRKTRIIPLLLILILTQLVKSQITSDITPHPIPPNSSSIPSSSASPPSSSSSSSSSSPSSSSPSSSSSSTQKEDVPADDDPNPEPPDYSKDYTTIYLSEFISQGAKIPKNPFFKLPHSSTYGKDQLTPNGEAQLYNLGVALNANYPKLFNPDTDKSQNPTKFYTAYSDSSPVSQASAISHLMGLYTPSDKFCPKITSEFFSDTKKPEYKTKVERAETFYPYYDNTYGFNRKRNYTRNYTQDYKKSPPEPLPHCILPHQIETSPDDQDFLFHSDFEASCPKLYPAVEKNWKLYLADMRKEILRYERFMDSKFLKEGFKELRGFEWTPHQVIRVYETLLSYYGEYGKSWNKVWGSYGYNWGTFKQNEGDDQEPTSSSSSSSSSSSPGSSSSKKEDRILKASKRRSYRKNGGYSGGLTGWLRIFSNLKGMWETGPRTRVREFIAAENYHFVTKLRHEFSKKINSDRKYVKALKAVESNGELKQDELDKAEDNYYQKNFLLFSGNHERFISFMMLLRISSYKCFKQKTKLRPDNSNDCLYMPEYPGPASNILMELLRKEDKYFVRVLYNGKAIKVCPGRYYCDFNEFFRTLGTRVNINFFKICANEKHSMVVINKKTQHIVKHTKWNKILGLTLIFQILLIIYVCCCCRKLRAKRLIQKEIRKKMKTSDRWSLKSEEE